MQIPLSSPAITCDHCIATIRGVVDATEGARLVSGDPDAKTYIVDLASGALLDAIAPRLAAADYPLGDVPTEAAAHGVALTADWRPSAQADPALESCCCGNQILVGAGAGARITSKLDAPERYRVEVQQVTMPWGQPLEVALAIPMEA